MREEHGNRSVIIENGLCGSDLPSDIIVPGTTAIVNFISRTSISTKQFSATWSMSKLPKTKSLIKESFHMVTQSLYDLFINGHNRCHSRNLPKSGKNSPKFYTLTQIFCQIFSVYTRVALKSMDQSITLRCNSPFTTFTPVFYSIQLISVIQVNWSFSKQSK